MVIPLDHLLRSIRGVRDASQIDKVHARPTVLQKRTDTLSCKLDNQTQIEGHQYARAQVHVSIT